MTIDLRKLYEGATPGQWAVRDAVNERQQIEAVVWTAADVEERKDGVLASTGTFPDKRAKPDARYIVEAHNAFPLLLDLVDAARAVLSDVSTGNELEAELRPALEALLAHLATEPSEP